MKTLLRLVVVVILLLAVGAFILRDSPWWTPFEIQRGLDDRDVERVERVIALERFSASSTAAMASLVAAELGVSAEPGADFGSKALAALVGVVATGVGEATARESAQHMRRAIREGRVEHSIGPFHINEGFGALGHVSTTIDGGTLELKGRCGDVDASLVLLLERHDDGPFGGRPSRYLVTGVELDSARTLAKQCRAATSSSAATAKRTR